MTFVLATLNDRGSGISGGEDWNMTELVEFDDFIVDRQNGILRNLNGAFVSGNRNYRITMAAGFKVGSAQPYVPADLEELCIAIAGRSSEVTQGSRVKASERGVEASTPKRQRHLSIQQSRNIVKSICNPYVPA